MLTESWNRARSESVKSWVMTQWSSMRRKPRNNNKTHQVLMTLQTSDICTSQMKNVVNDVPSWQRSVGQKLDPARRYLASLSHRGGRNRGVIELQPGESCLVNASIREEWILSSFHQHNSFVVFNAWRAARDLKSRLETYRPNDLTKHLLILAISSISSSSQSADR